MVTGNNDGTGNMSTITSAANLTIKMALSILAKPKSKKSPKYRAVKRADGVVIERPQYQPHNVPAKPDFKFEKKLLFLDNPAQVPSQKKRYIESIEADLLGLGAHTAECGSEEYEQPVHCGGEGYQNVNAIQSDDFERLRTDRNVCVHMSPMDHFLNDTGPWSEILRRNG
ncbi:hypothetical protein T440DRAFT_471580 [Plenodomus tracheiphilus IPT5]|uniref:Uncharacterized protein n=1 Tax=Plenodomus tracheiphilus IPT5 TaxID=1408161 RepID=A0A6A7AV68_9PLEO|nr:hypothetical protein T440DRAFT_471580 [Plenodomus tracheiphilus IPT5]